jgi:hypothetical protein
LKKKERCEKVVCLVRTPYDFSDEARKEKLTQTIVDFDNLKNAGVPAGITVAICCLGLRQPSKASKKDFVAVDVGYTEAFAKLCKASGVKHFSLVSAVNAAPKALSRFGRTKFKAEQVVKEVGFEKMSFFRPSILIAMGARYGFRDSMSQTVAPKFTGMLHTKYKEVRGDCVFCLFIHSPTRCLNRQGARGGRCAGNGDQHRAVRDAQGRRGARVGRFPAAVGNGKIRLRPRQKRRARRRPLNHDAIHAARNCARVT